MPLRSDSVPKDALTLHGLGHYEWLMSPMGLLALNFSKTNKKLMEKIDNFIVI
jgi:hypothetical protein